jgi:hypothetical protein
MSTDKDFHPIEYNCPICGERTTFGSHFCKGEPEPKRESVASEKLKRAAVGAVGVIMAEAMLWGMIGIRSLYVAAAAALIIPAALAFRKAPWRAAIGRRRRRRQRLGR